MAITEHIQDYCRTRVSLHTVFQSKIGGHTEHRLRQYEEALLYRMIPAAATFILIAAVRLVPALLLEREGSILMPC